MHIEPYKVGDFVLFVGPRDGDLTLLPGRTGTVVEVALDGDAIVKFDEQQVRVRIDDKRFRKDRLS